jgi:uncharacterized phage-like protein YoqJ
MILAVTGHRPPKLGGYFVPNRLYDAVVDGLRETIEHFNPERVLSGMSLGVDQWTAELCIEMGIPFVAVIPFRGYSSKWPIDSQRTFDRLCQSAQEVVYTSESTTYSGRLLYRRNVWMVEHADQIVAVYNGSSGGTANCIQYATQVGKPIELVNFPLEFWREAHAYEEAQAFRGSRSGRLSAAQPQLHLTWNDPTVMVDLSSGPDQTVMQTITAPDPVIPPTLGSFRDLVHSLEGGMAQDDQPEEPPSEVTRLGRRVRRASATPVPLPPPPSPSPSMESLLDSIERDVAAQYGLPSDMLGFRSRETQTELQAVQDEQSQRQIADVFRRRTESALALQAQMSQWNAPIIPVPEAHNAQNIARRRRTWDPRMEPPPLPAAHEPRVEPKKDAITPEMRFQPGRKLDWGDD